MPQRARQDQVADVLRYRHGLQHLTASTGHGPRPTTFASLAIGALAAWWFFLGSASVSARAVAGDTTAAMLATFGVLAAANLGALILSALAVRVDRRAARVFVVIVLVGNVVSSILDEIGVFDVAYALASVIALSVTVWAWRAQRRSGAS